MDDTSGKLLPNKLTVDNLTIDWLRSRLTDLETSLKTTQQNRQSPQFPQENNSDNRYKSFIVDIVHQHRYFFTIKFDICQRINFQASFRVSCTRILVLDYSREREELRLRCQEKKLQRQVDVIRGALNELGCEELPSGCDLSVEGTFTDSPAISKVSKIEKVISFSFFC